MERIINISGKEVKLASTAGTLYRYRMQFKRDLTKDIVKMEEMFKKLNDKSASFDVLDLELFENVAWTFAKTADPTIPPIENWLDQFEIFSIYKILPEMMEMLKENFSNISEKKAVAPLEVQQGK